MAAHYRLTVEPGQCQVLRLRLTDAALVSADDTNGEGVNSCSSHGFTVECPTGSGRQMNLYQVAEEISRRLTSIFLKGADGRRPVYGGSQKFQDDPHWRDCLLFYEYFHGDNGAGLGASHQTGWTGIIARTMHVFATLKAEQILTMGKESYARMSADAPGVPAIEPGAERS